MVLLSSPRLTLAPKTVYPSTREGLFSCFVLVLLAGLLWRCTPSQPPHETNTQDAAPHEKESVEGALERAALPDRKPPKIGTLCSNEADCATGLTCETQIPQGYCTKFCNHTRECPIYSACARITFEGGFQLQRCIRTCRDERDCREGFVCYGPPNAWDQICVPRIP